MNDSAMGFVYLGISAMGFLMLFLMYKGTQSCNQKQLWLEDKMSKIGISNNNIIVNSLAQEVLVYTPDDSMLVFNKSNSTVNSVKKSDILNIELDVYTIEKNVKRLIALTSTFDKHTRVSNIVFKVTTREKTYQFLCYQNGKDSMGRFVPNVCEMINDLSRYKLILEDDIKQINNSNI